MKSTLEILKDARNLIADEERWERTAFARTADGASCMPLDATACAWCAMGAIDFARGQENKLIWDEALTEVAISAKALGYKTIVNLNLLTNHATVLNAFDMAIARLVVGPADANE